MRRTECWYDSVCTIDDCRGCIRFLEMSSLMDNSGIPKTRQHPNSLYPDELDYDKFLTLADYKDNIVEHIRCGDNLYLWSATTGNGKTSWAIKIMLKYFDCIWCGNGFKPRGYFIHTPTFLARLKQFDVKDEDFEELKDNLATVDLVIWDDIAGMNMSNYDYGQLLTYLDRRIFNQKSNIFTSNCSPSDLDKLIGAKLTSRICNTSNIINLVGGDKRNGSIANLK